MREDFLRVVHHDTKPSRDVKLEIYYDPETDTLDIGDGRPAAEGYDVAENMTAHVGVEGDVVSVTLEQAVEAHTTVQTFNASPCGQILQTFAAIHFPRSSITASSHESG